MKKALSLYIHIPFCVKKCLYCDFLSGPATASERQDYILLLCQEITAWGEQLGREYRLETVFLGGGTPSCLSPDQLKRLGEAVSGAFDVSGEVEFTTEANPGTVTPEHGKAWQQIGVSRISLGLQSAQDEELHRLGRVHSYRQFLDTYALLRDSGFDNINIDLMADIPGQTEASFRDTLEKVVSLKPEHVSSYSLIVEPGTPFYEMERQGLLDRGDEEADRAFYELTGKYLGEHGYERYEISNYAMPGYQCRHNCVYWQCKEYLGVGLGASSYLGQYRFSNQAEGKEYGRYVRDMVRGKDTWREYAFREMIETDTTMQMEEYCFLGLRMQQGISRSEFLERFRRPLDEVYRDVLPRLFEQRLLAEHPFHDRIYLTSRGIDVSNQVMAEFLL